MSTPASELAALVERLGRPRVLLIGDLMVDQYIYGAAERLSPEAPVPVVLERYREQRAGGAGNVATALNVLGADVTCVGLHGQDQLGQVLVELLQKAGARTDGLIVTPHRPTCSKTRLVGLAQHRHPQQMLRLDLEDARPIDAELAGRVLAKITELLPSCDLVCLEDYNKGLLIPSLCQQIVAVARQLGKPILVDPAPISSYEKYRGVSAITPNRTEAERATGLTLRDGVDMAPQLAASLSEQLDLEACVLTLDRHGIYLLEKGQEGKLHPTRARKVYDVTGAGDMVLATLAVVRAGGATWSQAVDLANIAGGLEVERFGCVPIRKEEILQELISLDLGQRGKLRTAKELAIELDHRRLAGQKIVFTNGCFDILHAGHVQYLSFARQQGDCLVVGVNADASIRRLKGPTRPINTLSDRLTVLAGLSAVDYVVAFEEETPAILVSQVQPDVLVKGEDYAGKEVVGRDVVEARGGKVVLAPLLAGRSTSKIASQL